MGSLGMIAKRWKDALDDDDVNFELTVEVTIAENSDIVKIPSGFPRSTRCGCARTQGLSYAEPATDSEESDKEDQRLAEESSSGLAGFEGSENSGVETEDACFEAPAY